MEQGMLQPRRGAWKNTQCERLCVMITWTVALPRSIKHYLQKTEAFK